MQVKEVSKQGLKHEFFIKVPGDFVEKSLTKRLEEVAKTARIQGFRAGKVPLKIIRQRYGASLRAEVLEATLNDSVEKTLSERNLRPAVRPQLNDIKAEEGKDLEFRLAVEVFPEIKPIDFGKLSFERQLADVDDKAIDDAIARIAKSMRAPELVEEARGAKMGEVLTIDFDGTVDGKSFPGMKSENHRIELGSKSFIDDFEEQLVGLKVGDKKDVKVKFPKDYHAENLAGKKAVFAVAVKELRVHKPVEMNDDLAKEMGFPSLADLRKRISDDIGGNYSSISRSVLKRKLMDKLAESHDFPVPQGMLDAEFNAIWQQVVSDKAKGNLAPEDAKKSDEVLKKEYMEIAERRVRLGLLLAEVSNKNKIEISNAEIRNAMIAEARRFPGQEKAVIEYYSKTEGALERLRAPILEEKVVDFILSQAKITDKKIPADELMKMPDDLD